MKIRDRKVGLNVARSLNTVFTAAFAAFLVALSSFNASPALANSIASTSPAIGAVVASAPNAVSITTTGALLDQGNTLTVTDPSGTQVDDGSLTISDTTAVVGLTPLTSTGIYTVSYTLLSATDAPLTGSFTFLFNAPAAMTSPSATPTPSISISPQSGTVVASGNSKTTSTPVNSSASIAVIVLFIVATLVALFLLWYAGMIWVDFRKARRKKRKVAKSPRAPTRRSRNSEE